MALIWNGSKLKFYNIGSWMPVVATGFEPSTLEWWGKLSTSVPLPSTTCSCQNRQLPQTHSKLDHSRTWKHWQANMNKLPIRISVKGWLISLNPKFSKSRSHLFNDASVRCPKITQFHKTRDLVLLCTVSSHLFVFVHRSRPCLLTSMK